MGKIAFSYIRMSTANQLRGDSRRRQIDRSKKYAEQKGYEFKDTIEDIGVSAYRGKNFEEGELGKFIKAAEEGQFDPKNVVLLIESFDRFSRDKPLTAFGYLSDFIRTGITIETIIDGRSYSEESMKDIGELYTAIGVLFRSHDESKTKSDRLKESWEKKRKTVSEKPYTSRMPAWLKLDKTKNKIKTLEQPTKTILKIFDLCIEEDMGASSIARFLNENKDQFPKFTKPQKRNRNITRGVAPGWHESYIKKILCNKSVYGAFQTHKMLNGKQVPDGPEIPDYFPAIMEKSRFDLAQAKIRQRKVNGSGRKGKSFSNLFTRLIKCGSCGGTIRYIDKGKLPKGGQYLVCNNSLTKNECDAPYWRYDDFEDAFLKEVIELPLDELLTNENDSHTRTKLINEIESTKQEIVDIEEDHKNTRDEIRKAKRNKDTLSINGFESDLEDLGKAHEKSKSRLSKKESELALLESRLQKRSQEELVGIYRKMTNLSDADEIASTRRKMNSLIRSVVEKIVINNNFNHVLPWEILDENIPKNLVMKLEVKGYKTDFEKERFFITPYGRRLFNQGLREIKIFFKGGGIRTCRPSMDRSYKIERNSRKSVKNDSKRSPEKTRKHQKRTQAQHDLGKLITEELNSLEASGDLGAVRERIESLSEREKDAVSYFNETYFDQ